MWFLILADYSRKEAGELKWHWDAGEKVREDFSGGGDDAKG